MEGRSDEAGGRGMESFVMEAFQGTMKPRFTTTPFTKREHKERVTERR